MRLCMVAASLAGGGAERALLDTAVLLAARGHHVTVLTFNSESSDAYPCRPAFPGSHSAYRASPGTACGASRTTSAASPACGPKSAGCGPTWSCPISPGPTSSACWRCSERAGPWWLRNTTSPRSTTHRCRLYGARCGGSSTRAWRRSWSSAKAWPRSMLGWERTSFSVIHNFLPKSRGSEPETFRFLSDDVCYIVGMGRLEPEKGFDRLIKAFQLVERDCPGWKLLIVGEGSLRTELTRLVASLGLEDRIELPGRVSNPRTLFRQCDLFGLSSESEGFGLVLVEAMSAGLPVISFDCDFGPRDIITSNVSGILVPPGDVPALSRAIGRLVKDGALRARLARAGLESVSRFAPDEILDRWEALLRRVTNPGIAPREAHPSARGAERS